MGVETLSPEEQELIAAPLQHINTTKSDRKRWNALNMIDYNAAYDDLLRPSITKQSFRKSVASISKRRRLTSDPEDREYVKRAASAVIYVKEDNSRSTKQLRKFLAKVSQLVQIKTISGLRTPRGFTSESIIAAVKKARTEYDTESDEIDVTGDSESDAGEATGPAIDDKPNAQHEVIERCDDDNEEDAERHMKKLPKKAPLLVAGHEVIDLTGNNEDDKGVIIPIRHDRAAKAGRKKKRNYPAHELDTGSTEQSRENSDNHAEEQLLLANRPSLFSNFKSRKEAPTLRVVSAPVAKKQRHQGVIVTTTVSSIPTIPSGRARDESNINQLLLPGSNVNDADSIFLPQDDVTTLAPALTPWTDQSKRLGARKKELARTAAEQFRNTRFYSLRNQ